MRYLILKNYYAPMCGDWAGEDTTPSHGILARGCNFDCIFCNRTLQDDTDFEAYSDDDFAAAVFQLIPSGLRFKFSGGEPTLDATLRAKMAFVKQCGGFVFLDTNGSLPTRVAELMDEGLVDVLGVSLKGVTPESAIAVTGCRSRAPCWDNPLRTIQIAANHPEVRLIVTHVFFDQADDQELDRFAELLPVSGNVYIKLNNLLFPKHRVKGLRRLEPFRFIDMAARFLRRRPEWRNRTILVENEQAISHFSAIQFM